MKLIISSRKKEEPIFGELKQTKDGFLYVDMPNNIINAFYVSIDDKKKEKPPYNLKKYDAIGAHITVAYKDEIKDIVIDEIGEKIPMKIKKLYSVNPEGWDGMNKVWFLSIESPRLEQIRKKYNLTKLINKTHDFHITVAVRKK